MLGYSDGSIRRSPFRNGNNSLATSCPSRQLHANSCQSNTGWEQHATASLFNKLGGWIRELESSALKDQDRVARMLWIESCFTTLQSREGIDDLLKNVLNFLRARFEIHKGNMLYHTGASLCLVVANKAPVLEECSALEALYVPSVYKAGNDFYIVGYNAKGVLQSTRVDSLSSHKVYQDLYSGLKFPDGVGVLQLDYIPCSVIADMQSNKAHNLEAAKDTIDFRKWLGADMAQSGYQSLVSFYSLAQQNLAAYAHHFGITEDALKVICEKELAAQMDNQTSALQAYSALTKKNLSKPRARMCMVQLRASAMVAS